jgi:hypothetical protein
MLPSQSPVMTGRVRKHRYQLIIRFTVSSMRLLISSKLPTLFALCCFSHPESHSLDVAMPSTWVLFSRFSLSLFTCTPFSRLRQALGGTGRHTIAIKANLTMQRRTRVVISNLPTGKILLYPVAPLASSKIRKILFSGSGSKCMLLQDKFLAC